MPDLPDIFAATGPGYRADTCEPLKRAAASGTLRLVAFGRGGYPGARLPATGLPGLRSVGVWDAPTSQDWGLDPHRNEGIEITYLERGACGFATDAGAWRLRGGDLAVTRPWQRHLVGDPRVGACRLHWLILDVGVRRPDQDWRWPSWLLLEPREIARLTELLRCNEDPIWHADEAVAQQFARLGAELAAGDERLWTRLRLRINAVLLALLDLLERRQAPLDPRLASSLGTVERFLAELPRHVGEAWTLQAMAAQCGLSRTRFAHYCRQLTNAAPMEHLGRLRVAEAARRLRAEPRTSITAIALACGFGSSQHFATAFRRRMGVSARAWRARPAPPDHGGAPSQPTPSVSR